MNTILTVFLKEAKVSIRDKRTLLTTVLLPAVVFPLLIVISSKIQQNVSASKNEDGIKITFLNAPGDLKPDYFPENQFELLSDYTKEAAQIALENESLDAYIDFGQNFMNQIQSNKTANVTIYYKSTNLLVLNKISEQLIAYNDSILNNRLTSFNISKNLIQPIDIKQIDSASNKEQIGAIVGGFLPYMFVIFCFMGCMYPAIELITGEKEKNTMETLLTTPASRFSILIGKTLTMTVFGVLSAITTLLGVYICIQFLNEIPEEILISVEEILSPKFVLLLLGMLIPLAFFFSSAMSALAISAHSFKEAQSKIQPLLYSSILPVAIGLFPSIVLNWKTACVPILNVSLTTKEIIADTIDPKFYIVTVISTIIIALIAIYLSYKNFSKESMVLN